MSELEGIDAATASLLHTYGFDEATFLALRERLVRGEAGAEGNRIRGQVTPPEAGDVLTLPPPGTPERERLAAKGRALIAEGGVASVILAGGMATRFGGVVKAGVEAAAGKTFLELKLADAQMRVHMLEDQLARTSIQPRAALDVRRLELEAELDIARGRIDALQDKLQKAQRVPDVEERVVVVPGPPGA
ncbi:MAG: hypothetical protein AAGH15_12425, partial [Myxococcota bacterium]